MVLAALWGNLYLVQGRHLTEMQASTVTSMLFVGMIFGPPLVGWVSDQLGRRKPLMIFGAMFSILMISLIIGVPGGSFAMFLVLFLLLGFAASFQVLSYPLVAETTPKELTSISMSVLSILFNLSIAVAQPLFGWLINFSSHQASAPQSVGYSLHDYRFALFMLPAAFVISLLASVFVKDKT